MVPGEGDTIVLVHGICGNLGIWAMNLPALAATGRSVAHASRAGRPERDPGRCVWERSTGRQSARSGGARADAGRVGRCGHDQPTSGHRDDVARRLGVSPARTGGSTLCFGSSFSVVRLLSGAGSGSLPCNAGIRTVGDGEDRPQAGAGEGAPRADVRLCSQKAVEEPDLTRARVRLNGTRR